MGYLLLPIILLFASHTELSAQSKKIVLKSSEYKNGKTTFVWELKTSKDSKLNFSNFIDCLDEDDVDDVRDKEKDEDEDDDKYDQEKSEKDKKGNYRSNSGKSQKNKFSLSEYLSSKSRQEEDDSPGPADAFSSGKKLKKKQITLVLKGKYTTKSIKYKRNTKDGKSEDEECDIPVKVKDPDHDDDKDDHDGDHEICLNDKIESDDDDDDSKDFKWFKVGNNIKVGSSRSFQPAESGKYLLIYTDEDGCEQEEEHDVKFKNQTKITAQPVAPAAVCIGATPGTLSVTATGQGTLKYQWYTGATKIAGATSSTYSPSGAVAGSFEFSVVVTGECGDVTSNKVTVVVNALPVATITALSATTFCAGGSVELTADQSKSYLWSNGATTPSITVSTSGSFTVTLTDVNGCTSIPSAPTSTTARLAFSAGTISAAGQTICFGDNPVLIGSTSEASGGDLSFSYKWQANGADIAGANGISYDPPAGLSVTTTYTRFAKDGTCNTAFETSGSYTVAVRPVFSAGTISAAGETICFGGNPNLIGSTFAASGGDLSFSYKWQANGADIAGANDISYDPPAGLSVTTTYTRFAKDGTCNTSFELSSGSYVVTVNPLPTITASANAKAVCFSTGAQTTPLTYSATTNAPTTYSISWSGTPLNSFDAVNNDPLTSSSISIAVPAGTLPGTYTGTLFVKNANGCVSTGVAFTITVHPKPAKHPDHKEDHNHGGVSKEVSLKPTGSNTSNWYWNEGSVEKSSNSAPKPSTEKSGQKYKYQYSQTNAHGCESDRSNVDIHIVSVPYYTFTQSYYGSKKGKVCIITEVKDGKAAKTTTYNRPIDLYNASLSKLTGYSLKLGEKGGKDGYKGMFIISRNESVNLNGMLPMSGKSDAIREAYECNSNDKKSKERALKVNNELLGQVIALALNTGIPEVGDDLGNFDLSKAGDKCIITKRAPGCVDRKEEKYDREDDDCDADDRDDDKKRFISSKVLNGVAGSKSINDLVKFAVDVLFDKSKLPANVSYKDITKTLKAVNEAFDRGRFFVAFTDCKKGKDDDDDDDRKKRSAAMTMIGAQEEMGASSNGGSVSVAVGAFPNPYNDKISFRLTAKQTAKSSLVIYNMLGQKVANLFEGEMQANTTTNIEYNVPAAQRKNLVFVFRNGTYSTTGKLIKAN
jgi:hypothetical protein